MDKGAIGGNVEGIEWLWGAASAAQLGLGVFLHKGICRGFAPHAYQSLRRRLSLRQQCRLRLCRPPPS